MHGLILRAWRDGSVHAEVPIAAFHTEGVLGVHLDHREDGHRVKTACGLGWFGIGSSSGYGHPERVSCEACRAILLGESQ
jgi:hypothetical protein